MRGDTIVREERVVRYTLSERVMHWLAGFSYLYLLMSGLAFYAPQLYWLAAILGGGDHALSGRADRNRRIHHSRLYGIVHGAWRLPRHGGGLRLAAMGQSASPALVQPRRGEGMNASAWDRRIARAEQLACASTS